MKIDAKTILELASKIIKVAKTVLVQEKLKKETPK
jgi:hypothetical protein